MINRDVTSRYVTHLRGALGFELRIAPLLGQVMYHRARCSPVVTPVLKSLVSNLAAEPPMGASA